MKKIIGSIIILVGVLFLFSNYDVIIIDNMWGYIWTISIIAVGITGIVSRKQFDFLFSAFILIGTLFLFKETGIINQGFINKTLGPILIIIIGITFFINYSKYTKTNGKFKKYLAVFSGIEEKVEDNAYVGNEVTAIFGGVELDLRKVKFKDKVTHMNMTVAFGGIDIIVPKNVKVTTNGLPIFGGIENKVTNNEKYDYEIIINYNIVFGGIEIKD